MAPAPHDLLDIQTLRNRYISGQWSPLDVMDEVLRRIDACTTEGIWIHRLSRDGIRAQVQAAVNRRMDGLPQPLYGIPFVIKDNIDFADHPTTAACREFSYIPEKSAAVVQKLLDAGAFCVGKTNLDQFATGLVGVRSPYGACQNSFNRQYISGGSSSGSAVAVALGLVTFSLGTDTAGSGRVPAAFNNIVGLKPSRGLLSTRGVVPACRSLDCVSIFAHTCDDAAEVLAAAQGFDPSDSYSRHVTFAEDHVAAEFRFAVPHEHDLEFFGDTNTARCYAAAIDHLKQLGGTVMRFDYTPFLEAARLLYEDAWIAERPASIGAFADKHADAMLPVIRTIFSNGSRFDARAAFGAMHKLQALKRQTEGLWKDAKFMLLPTAGTIYKIADVQADPIGLNKNLGHYTNFVNLLDLMGIAVPAGFGSSGLPIGVTLIAPAGHERRLLPLADRLHRALSKTAGATNQPLPRAVPPASPPDSSVKLAVVGAHLTGQPLNHQLTQRNARLIRACHTAPSYRLYALANTTPPKPGLVRVTDGRGAAIEVEVWSLSPEAFGTFVNEVPAPLGIGTLVLDDGTSVKGFICEPAAIIDATDITAFGGWRSYQASLQAAK